MSEQEARDRFDDLIRGLRQGDGNAAAEFCRQYGQALERVAESRLPKGLRRRIGPEDVVQSACRTFLRRAKEGQFELTESRNVWSLLCAITLTKVRELSRFHLREKRGVGQEVAAEFSSSAGVGSAPFAPADPSPSPGEAAEIADQFRHIFESLDEEERQIVELKLEDLTNEQVADRLGSSERTVRRVLKQLQTRLVRELDSSVRAP
jgi:RNA polymerase sigma factor (sigma-70 family)